MESEQQTKTLVENLPAADFDDRTLASEIVESVPEVWGEFSLLGRFVPIGDAAMRVVSTLGQRIEKNCVAGSCTREGSKQGEINRPRAAPEEGDLGAVLDE